ncbi:hypothetical protein HN011_008791 [Eciton burchellii]|nr:hypothetical protein HN011_008791 [Eciton burchellii]
MSGKRRNERSAGAAGGRTEGRNSKVAGESVLECTQASTWLAQQPASVAATRLPSPRQRRGSSPSPSTFTRHRRQRRLPRPDQSTLGRPLPFFPLRPLTFESSHGGERIQNAVGRNGNASSANPRSSSSTITVALSFRSRGFCLWKT